MAFWSEFASAFAAQVYSVCASVTAVYLRFFVFGRVLTNFAYIDLTLSSIVYTSVVLWSCEGSSTGILSITAVHSPRNVSPSHVVLFTNSESQESAPMSEFVGFVEVCGANADTSRGSS